MKKEDFWKPGTYPTTPPDNRRQPSDDEVHRQKVEWLRRLQLQNK